ncbi:MAG: type II toxin-antitoxin system HicB family antitoxin [archaeon]
MSKTYTLVIEQDEDGWFVSDVIELPGCHTQAMTMDELLCRTREAISAYLQEEKDDIVPTRFVGVQQVEV